MKPLNRKSRVAVAAIFSVVSLMIVFGINYKRYIVTVKNSSKNRTKVFRSQPVRDSNRRRPREATLSIPELNRAIHLSATYLRTSLLDNGQFVYRVNLDSRYNPQPRYNILRHAGAIYALAEYDGRHPSPETKIVLTKASHFLHRSISPITGSPGMLAVWSDPKINKLNSPRQCKLGGSGLALIALCQVEEVIPKTTELEILRCLGRFILFMQNGDGSFCSKFVPSTGGKDDQWSSVYYPGEAALGLIMLYERDPDPKWLKAAVDALLFLARTRRGQKQVPADHWALLATARLIAHFNRPETKDLDQTILEQPTIQICESILQQQPEFTGNSKLRGGFASDGRTCPTATRLEGLIASLEILSSHHSPLQNRIERSAKSAAEFLLRCQLVRGDYVGGMTRAATHLSKKNLPPTPGFNRRVGEIRIDYIQHSMCAWMQYRDLLFRKSLSPSLNRRMTVPVSSERPSQ